MLSGYSTTMLLLMLAFAAAGSFYLGNAMNSILGTAGFGVLGNMLVLLFGLLIGIGLVDHLPRGNWPPQVLLAAAIGFSFAILFGLAVIKRLVSRV